MHFAFTSMQKANGPLTPFGLKNAVFRTIRSKPPVFGQHQAILMKWPSAAL